jgi:hypothetical protein
MAHARCMLDKQDYTRLHLCTRPSTRAHIHTRKHAHTRTHALAHTEKYVILIDFEQQQQLF